MPVSTLIALVWVFLVSIDARGWATTWRLPDLIFWVGMAFIVVRLLEWLGIIGGTIGNPRHRKEA